MDLEKLIKEIGAKLQLLDFKKSKGKDIVEKKNITTLERHVDALAALAREVDEIKVKIEARKLEEGASIDEVGVWISEINAKIEGVDVEIEYLRNFLSEMKEQSQLVEREKQLEFEKEKLEMKLEYEKRCEEFKKGETRAIEWFARQITKTIDYQV